MSIQVSQLRNSMSGKGILVVPGAYDALSARVIEEAGFETVHVGGYLGSACLLGLPDVGLLTMTEAINRAGNIAAAVHIPVIMDIDNGYGNAINVWRTAIEVTRAGIAGVHIEDQILPKRFSQFGTAGTGVVETKEMIAKIHAIRDVAPPEELYLIARTDALEAGLGVDEAIDRLNAYTEAGADAVFPITRSYDWLMEIGDKWSKDTPLVVAPTWFANVSAEEFRGHGFRMVLYTDISVRAALQGVRETMNELRSKGTISAIDRSLVSSDYLHELIRASNFHDLEQRYRPTSQPTL
jgi:2-methylisocitrate lyase-like PEP mutase family enzyme